jgi:1,4-dihydroxy-6-naphthoate synthase
VSNEQSAVVSAQAVTDISIAHSPDSDDAFMFYGLATNKVRVPGYRFSHTLSDIETLNRRAQDEAFFDVTAISFHAYPYIQKDYTLMGCGGSVGEGYGPMVVSNRPLAATDLEFFPASMKRDSLSMKGS